MREWGSSWKDGKAVEVCICVCVREKSGRKMEKQLVVVEANGRAAGKAEKHTAGEGGQKGSWGGWRWKSRKKVAGKGEKQAGAWKSTWEDEKAAGRMGKRLGEAGGSSHWRE